MKILCDGKVIHKSAVPTFEGIDSLFRAKSTALVYIEGGKTHDTLRYGHRDGKLPFEMKFTDRHNHDWTVIVEEKHDAVTMFVPTGMSTKWFGADENPTITGSDAQTGWASVQFSFQDSTWLPPFHPGIRIDFTPYKDKGVGEWLVDTARWNSILDLAKKGTEVSGAVLDQVEKGAAMYATYGASGALPK